jgi:hypothetical protein
MARLLLRGTRVWGLLRKGFCMMFSRTLLLAAAASTLLASGASAAVMNYRANIQPLNNSGVTGTANFSHDTTANTLSVRIRASGLAPSTPHPQHIHGAFADAGCRVRAAASSQVAGLCIDGTPSESNIPTIPANDLDGDGFLETVEGTPAYGPINLILSDPAGGAMALPMSDANGNLFFEATYDLASTDLLFDEINGVEHDADDLFPLTSRVFVIHGGIVTNGPGLDPGEVGSDTDDEFVVLLPQGAGELMAVPEPGMLGLLGLGVLGLAAARRRKTA